MEEREDGGEGMEERGDGRERGWTRGRGGSETWPDGGEGETEVKLGQMEERERRKRKLARWRVPAVCP